MQDPGHFAPIRFPVRGRHLFVGPMSNGAIVDFGTVVVGGVIFYREMGRTGYQLRPTLETLC